jgi:disulfide bond formation protein DsbB
MAALTAPTSSRIAAMAVLAVGGATIAGALVSQHVFGLVPCKLCLLQRWPYYVGLPLAAATAAAPAGPLRRTGLALLALLFLGSAGLGGYHAGAEWGLWPGPNDCGGGVAGPASAGDLLSTLETTRIVSCTEAAWRFLGLSLAGWNALVSLGLAGSAAWGASRTR